ncbi:flagellar hook-length control protein FliK [Gammaproteobacteria bacterium]
MGGITVAASGTPIPVETILTDVRAQLSLLENAGGPTDEIKATSGTISTLVTPPPPNRGATPSDIPADIPSTLSITPQDSSTGDTGLAKLILSRLSAVSPATASTRASGEVTSFGTASSNAVDTAPSIPIALSGFLSSALSAQRLSNGIGTGQTITRLGQSSSSTLTGTSGNAAITLSSVDQSPLINGSIDTPGGVASITEGNALSIENDFNDVLTATKDSASQSIVDAPNAGDSSMLSSSVAPPPLLGKEVGQSPEVPLALDTPHWETDLGQRVNWAVQHQLQRAELQITPEHLGPLNLQIEIKDGQTLVSFSTPHASVRQTIENSLPQLREMLETQGLQLAGAGVHQQGSGNTSKGWWQQQELSRNEGRRGKEAVNAPVLRPVSSRGLVDYFA